MEKQIKILPRQDRKIRELDGRDKRRNAQRAKIRTRKVRINCAPT